MWTKIRGPIAAVLMTVAAFQVGKNLGFREGVQIRYGGPGTFKTAVVEWQDFNERKAVLYLNDGANGYAFWFQMKPGFLHYTYCAKIFCANNEDDRSIRNAMDDARDWCKNEWDGGDTRISDARPIPRADADAEEADAGTVRPGTHESVELVTLREEVDQLRKDCAEVTLQRDLLRKKLGIDQ